MVNTHRFRCPECRTRRTSFVALVEHCRQHGHGLCTCGGYHFAHRPGSPYCERNPMAALRHAMRADNCSDAELLDIEMDCAWHHPGLPLNVWPP